MTDRNKYLFITFPNNSGSSMILNYLSKCQNAITMDTYNKEGQFYFIYKSPEEHEKDPKLALLDTPIGITKHSLDCYYWTEKLEDFQNELKYNWPAIIDRWNECWHSNMNYTESGNVLLEKSPTNLARTQFLQKYFPNAIFALGLRDPYATVEGMQRKYKEGSIERATNHWIKTAYLQRENLEKLKDSVWFTYEQICDEPDFVKDLIIKNLPELYDLDFSEGTSIHGNTKQRLFNRNEIQIGNLSGEEIDEITSILKNHQDVVDQFGYPLRGNKTSATVNDKTASNEKMLINEAIENPNLSLCMIVKNEEKYLGQCLESIKDLVDEMIIVDTGSTDSTVQIAESYGAQIHHHPWQGSFSEARNFGLQYATCDWILQLDADEELEKKDFPLLKRLIKSDQLHAIFLAILNDTKTGWSKHYFQRLFRRGKAQYEGIVHNQLKYNGPDYKSEIRLYHWGYNLSEDVMQKKFKRTEDLLLQQLEKDPSDPFSHQNYVRVIRAQERLEDAVKAAKQALKVARNRMDDIHYQMITYDMAICQYLLGQYKDSEQSCQDILDLNPRNLDGLFTMGGVQFKLGEFGKALECFQSFLKYQKVEHEDPKHSVLIVDTYSYDHQVYGNISDCYFHLGWHEQSKEAAQKAVQLNPKESLYKITLARTLIHLNEIEDARKILNTFHEKGTTTVQFYEKWCTLCASYPQLDDPIVVLQKGIETFPESENLYNLLAFQYFDRNSYDCESMWQKTLKINPNHTGARMGLAKYYGHTKNEEAFQNQANILLKGNPRPLIYKELGACAILLGNFEYAIELLSQYLKERKEDWNILVDISTCYAKQGDYDTALVGYKKVIENDPDNVRVRENLPKVLELAKAQTQS